MRGLTLDHEGRQLELFAKRHLGFRDAGNLLSRPLTPPKPLEAAGNGVGMVPTDTEGERRTANVRL